MTVDKEPLGYATANSYLFILFICLFIFFSIYVRRPKSVDAKIIDPREDLQFAQYKKTGMSNTNTLNS